MNEQRLTGTLSLWPAANDNFEPEGWLARWKAAGSSQVTRQ